MFLLIAVLMLTLGLLESLLTLWKVDRVPNKTVLNCASAISAAVVSCHHSSPHSSCAQVPDTLQQQADLQDEIVELKLQAAVLNTPDTFAQASTGHWWVQEPSLHRTPAWAGQSLPLVVLSFDSHTGC